MKTTTNRFWKVKYFQGLLPKIDDDRDRRVNKMKIYAKSREYDKVKLINSYIGKDIWVKVWILGDTYYAKFSPEKYQISFETNGGNATLNSINYTILDNINLPNPGSRDNFEFLGWCTKQDLSDEPISSLEVGNFGDIVLYAKWKGVNRTAVLNPKDGVVAIDKQITAVFNAPVLSFFGFFSFLNLFKMPLKFCLAVSGRVSYKFLSS